MDKPVTLTLNHRQQAALMDAMKSWQRHLGEHELTLLWIARYAQALHEIKQLLEPNDDESVE